MNNIKWLYPKKTSLENIQKVENYFNIKFPDDYFSCILLNNGAHPKPNTFNLGNMEESINNLLLIDIEETFGILKLYNGIKNSIPKKVIPFARDGGDNYICFDYRKDITNPTVVFWDYEKACREYYSYENVGFDDEKYAFNYDKAITYICDSFTELLNMLHEPEEE